MLYVYQTQPRKLIYLWCGCSSLVAQPPDELAKTLDLVRKARITVVSLPLVNLWTQDRDKTARVCDCVCLGRMVFGKERIVTQPWWPLPCALRPCVLRSVSLKGTFNASCRHMCLPPPPPFPKNPTTTYSNPLQRTPRWRGVTLLHELKAAGVPVAIASDNTRDQFYAYGDLDMLEVCV
jgi:hypothetical protein